MNDSSVCARWRTEPWDCAMVHDSLIDPFAFNPPVSPNGHVNLSVLAFHATYPEGRVFTRARLGDHWTRAT